MNFLKLNKLKAFRNNKVSNEFVTNMISDSNNQSLDLWYGFYFTDSEIAKEIPKAGHCFVKETQFNSKKFNNKHVHCIKVYMNFWSETNVEMYSLYEAEVPFSFLESHTTTKDKKGKLISNIHISLKEGQLTSFINDKKNKSKIFQNNVEYSLNHLFYPVQWMTSKERTIGNKKSFLILSEESGIFEEENYEISEIKEVYYNDMKDRHIKTKILIFDKFNDNSIANEIVINSMNICQEFGFPQHFLKAKLESKEKALEKIIH